MSVGIQTEADGMLAFNVRVLFPIFKSLKQIVTDLSELLFLAISTSGTSERNFLC
jgi:hypothetical protein